MACPCRIDLAGLSEEETIEVIHVPSNVNDKRDIYKTDDQKNNLSLWLDSYKQQSQGPIDNDGPDQHRETDCLRSEIDDSKSEAVEERVQPEDFEHDQLRVLESQNGM